MTNVIKDLFKKHFIVFTTGELEFALVCYVNGVNLKIYDYSNSNCLSRNRTLVSRLGAGGIYNVKSGKFLILHKILSLLTWRLALSGNSYAVSGVKNILQRIFRVSFFRDALIARPKVNPKRYTRFYCDPESRHFYPNAGIIELPPGSLQTFIQSIINPKDQDEQHDTADCIIIGKQMNRTAQGRPLKKQFYQAIQQKFNHVVIIPHPRETQDEIDLINQFGFEISDAIPYLLNCNGKSVFIVGGSTGSIFKLFEIPYYWVFFEEEFIFHGGGQGLHGGSALHQFNAPEEIKNYKF